jgi:hypothetical protein
LVIGLPVHYFVLFLWPLDCLYFILYFFFRPLWYLQTLLNNMLILSYFFYQGCD